jgi:hypothetical protein
MRQEPKIPTTYEGTHHVIAKGEQKIGDTKVLVDVKYK